MLERPLGLLGDIDLAFLQPLDQVVGRQINQLDAVGAVEYRIRHGFTHPHMRDLRDDVVEAFDVLDVDCGIDVDATREQFFDVEVALRVAKNCSRVASTSIPQSTSSTSKATRE